MLIMGGVVARSSLSAFHGTAAEPFVDAGQFRTQRSSDREVLRKAIEQWVRNGTGVLRLERGRTYDLGIVTDRPSLFEVSGLRNAVFDGNGAIIRARSAKGNVWNLLSFSNAASLDIINLTASDSAYVDEAWGMKMIVLQPGGGGTHSVGIANILAVRALAMVWAQGPVQNRVCGINFGVNCRARHCYYALGCENQGDEVHGVIDSVNCRRAYIAYGVEGHDLEINIHHDGLQVAAGAQSAVLVKSYGRATRNVTLRLGFTGSLPYYAQVKNDRLSGACVTIEHQSADGEPSSIDDIDIEVDIADGIEDPFGAYLAAITSIGRDGSVERVTRNSWSRITIRGRTGKLRKINTPSAPETPFTLKILGDADRIIATAAHRNINIDRALVKSLR